MATLLTVGHSAGSSYDPPACRPLPVPLCDLLCSLNCSAHSKLAQVQVPHLSFNPETIAGAANRAVVRRAEGDTMHNSCMEDDLNDLADDSLSPKVGLFCSLSVSVSSHPLAASVIWTAPGCGHCHRCLQSETVLSAHCQLSGLLSGIIVTFDSAVTRTCGTKCVGLACLRCPMVDVCVVLFSCVFTNLSLLFGCIISKGLADNCV